MNLSWGNFTYFWEVEEEGIWREGATWEEHVRHPALLIVTGNIFVREDMHKELYIIVNGIKSSVSKKGDFRVEKFGLRNK